MCVCVCVCVWFFLWRFGLTRALASSFLRFLDHTQRRATVGRTPLDEWSGRRRDLNLTTHTTYNRQTSMPIYIYIWWSFGIWCLRLVGVTKISPKHKNFISYPESGGIFFKVCIMKYSWISGTYTDQISVSVLHREQSALFYLTSIGPFIVI